MDDQTLYLVLFTTLLIQTLALLLSWRQNPHELGLRDWGISAALMTAGSLTVLGVLFLTSQEPGEGLPLWARLARDAGSALAGSGWLLAWLGTRRFCHRPATGSWTLLVFWLLLTLVLVPGSHLPGWRILVIGLVIAGFGALIVWELNRRRTERDPVALMASLAMIVVVVAWFGRALVAMSDLAGRGGASMMDLLCIYASIVMSMSFTLALILMTNQRIHQRLRGLAAMDPLTGALNRRAFFEGSRALFGGLRREDVRLAICVLDIDHFKHVNDNHGHAAGDRVLVAFSELARGGLREGDLFSRFGGEEFVILFQQGNATQASQAIERLRQAWRSHQASGRLTQRPVTFSAGISHVTGPCETSLESLLKAADNALYQAKAAGRDRCVIWQASTAGNGVTIEAADGMPPEARA